MASLKRARDDYTEEDLKRVRRDAARQGRAVDPSAFSAAELARAFERMSSGGEVTLQAADEYLETSDPSDPLRPACYYVVVMLLHRLHPQETDEKTSLLRYFEIKYLLPLLASTDA